MGRRVTIKDVAQELGISQATVSGALNGVPGYAAKTVSRVWEVANRLQYAPSKLARSLRFGEENPRERTRIIMHIIQMNKPVPEHNQDLESAVFRLAWEAQKRNFFSIPYTYYQLDGFHCPPLLNGYVDGAIVGTAHPEVIQAVATKVPTVLVDVPFNECNGNMVLVNGDWSGGFRRMIGELKAAGHRSSAVLFTSLGNGDKSMETFLLDKFTCAAGDLSFAINHQYSFSGEFSPDCNEDLLMQYLPLLIEGIRRKKVSALFTPSGYYAVFLKARLAEAGIDCPRNITLFTAQTELKPEADICTLFCDRANLYNSALTLLADMLGNKQVAKEPALVETEILKNKSFGVAPF